MDTTTSQPAAVVDETANDPSDEEGEAEFTLQSVSKAYYTPDQRSEAEAYLAKIMEVCEEKQIRTNFPDGDASKLPDNYGLAFVPVGKTVKDKGRVTELVLFCGVPSFEAIAENQKGEAFIRDTVTDACLSKLGNVARQPNKRAILPFEIEAFFERVKKSQDLESFNMLQRPIVKALKEQGFVGMTKSFLRQVLQSAKIAEQAFPKVSQENWDKMLDMFVLRCEQYVNTVTEQPTPLDPAVFIDWKAHRYDTEEESEELTSVDFDAISQAA